MTRACFVIAPLGEPDSPTRKRTNSLMQHIIRPAAKACNYAPTLATDDEHPGLIHSRILGRVMNDPLVIADLTDRNPNVYYELAIRHYSERPFIQMIAEGQELPFDIAPMQTIRYNLGDPDSVVLAKRSLASQMRNIDTAGAPLETPVSMALSRNNAAKPPAGIHPVAGKHLFQHKGCYPITLKQGRIPSLEHSIFLRALAHFTDPANYDRLAAMDLVYLREDNLSDEFDILQHRDLPLYENLLRTYDLAEFALSCRDENTRIFKNYVRLVNNIGDTLKGMHFEVVLHNVRNPIRSIVAARNSEEVSGRKVGDPSTRFVVQYVKDQGERLIQAMDGGSKVCYLKKLDGKNVKATTIPLYHDQYGLFAILCLNIDIDHVSALQGEAITEFLVSFVRNSGVTPDFE